MIWSYYLFQIPLLPFLDPYLLFWRISTPFAHSPWHQHIDICIALIRNKLIITSSTCMEILPEMAKALCMLMLTPSSYTVSTYDPGMWGVLGVNSIFNSKHISRSICCTFCTRNKINSETFTLSRKYNFQVGIKKPITKKDAKSPNKSSPKLCDVW